MVSLFSNAWVRWMLMAHGREDGGRGREGGKPKCGQRFCFRAIHWLWTWKTSNCVYVWPMLIYFWVTFTRKKCIIFVHFIFVFMTLANMLMCEPEGSGKSFLKQQKMGMITLISEDIKWLVKTRVVGWSLSGSTLYKTDVRDLGMLTSSGVWAGRL